MKVDVVDARELGAAELARWAELQQASPVYRSPFFRPEFTTVVAELRNVRVAVLEQDGELLGFFPFEVGRGRGGWPVAWPRSNYHGPVVDSKLALDPRALVRACGLVTWSFDHLPAGLEAFGPHAFARSHSPCVDLSEGFAGYLAARRAHADVRDVVGRRARKLGREVGPLRFVSDSDDGALLARLIEWKRAQYAETGVRDVLADARSRELLERVHEARGAEFSGVLSVLYAGDIVAALHLGLRSSGVWHSWFPAYNDELGRYSPGLMLFVELARAGAALGIREIDLGKGEARYKQALATGYVDLVEGCVGARPIAALPARIRTSARRGLRRVGVHRAVRRAVRRLRQ